MSRPFININSVSHAGNTVSLDYSYGKLRNYNQSATMTITGFSNSVSYTETRTESGVSLRTNGDPYESQDVTVGSLGTNIKIQILGVTATPTNGITAASGVLTDYINLVASSLAFTGAAAPFTLTYSTSGLTSSLIIKPTNTGYMYNNVPAIFTILKGTNGSTLTYSIGTTFSGGITDYNFSLYYAQNGYTDYYTFRKTGI